MFTNRPKYFQCLCNKKPKIDKIMFSKWSRYSMNFSSSNLTQHNFKFPSYQRELKLFLSTYTIKYNYCQKVHLKTLFPLRAISLICSQWWCLDYSQKLHKILDKVSHHPKLFFLLTSFVRDNMNLIKSTWVVVYLHYI